MSETNIDSKREKSTVINMVGATITGTGSSMTLNGVTAKCTFTFSKDADAKKAGKWDTVRDLTVDMTGPLQNIIAAALHPYIISLQNSRDDKDVLLKLNGGTIKFGESLAGKRARTVKVVQVRELTPIEKLDVAIEQMESAGLEVPEALLEKLYQLKVEAGLLPKPE